MALSLSVLFCEIWWVGLTPTIAPPSLQPVLFKLGIWEIPATVPSNILQAEHNFQRFGVKINFVPTLSMIFLKQIPFYFFVSQLHSFNLNRTFLTK